ncbi:MAG: hypothetical protein M1818_008371 [Claussenomyces sp. TS43310]|nr:MAG: hypothetical protein M1818_008371 [Claussenomyces sp. TS43310]
MFREAEGMLIISTQESAGQHGLEYTFPSRMITLNVHSSLEAIGFIAAIGTRVTDRGIGVNPVSAYFHDHLFVTAGSEAEAMQVLKEMKEEAIAGLRN